MQASPPVNQRHPSLPPGFAPASVLDGRPSTYTRARRESDNARVILKGTAGPADKRAVASLRQEFALGQNLHHPCIVKSLECLETLEGPVLAVEDFSDLSLVDVLPATGMPLSQAMPLMLQLVEAIVYLHSQRVVHASINPAHILIDAEGKQIKLSDFGMSFLFGQDPGQAYFSSTASMGELAYVAPEQTGRLDAPIDFRADLYSLGATFHKILSGRPPFIAANALGLIHSHLTQPSVDVYDTDDGVRGPLNQIVARLLAKGPEERYQSSDGVLRDLRQCAAIIAGRESADAFALDVADGLSTLPTKLRYVGHRQERARLLAAFERARAGGEVAAVVVSGPAGVGKTAFVETLAAQVDAAGGWLVRGKYTLEQQGIPGSALFAAFDSVAERLLALDDNELSSWRSDLSAALGAQSRVIGQVIPALQTVLGSEAPQSFTEPVLFRHRFSYLFKKFIGVFCNRLPVVLFMDDLQWADSHSLQLLEAIISDKSAKSLLLVGSYRNDSVAIDRPVNGLLAAARALDCNAEVSVSPLGLAEVAQLLQATLGTTQQDLAELGDLVYDKTLGNPLAVSVLLHRMFDQGFLRYESDCGWRWDAEEIGLMPVSVDVADELVSQVQEIEASVTEVLTYGALLGFGFNLEPLSLVVSLEVARLVERLQSCVRKKFLVRTSGGFRFTHDRVREAVLAELSRAEIEQARFLIGERLLQTTEVMEESDKMLVLLEHANCGVAFLTDTTKRAEFAELNLLAVEHIKLSGAHDAAWSFAISCLDWLSPPGVAAGPAQREALWQADPERARRTLLKVAEAAYLTGHSDEASKFVEELLQHADGLMDTLPAHEIAIHTAVAEGQLLQAVRQAFDVLAGLHVQIPESDDEHLDDEIASLEAELLSIGLVGEEQAVLDRLAALPPMTNPGHLAAMRIMASLIAPLYIVAIEQMSQMVMVALRLTLREGRSPQTAFLLVAYGLVLLRRRRMERAAAVGRASLRYSERDPTQTNGAKISVIYRWSIECWHSSLRETVAPMVQSHQMALEEGDPLFASVAGMFIGVHEYLAGSDLARVAKTMEAYSEGINTAGQHAFASMLAVWQQTVHNLASANREPWHFDGAYYSEKVDMQRDLDAGNRAAVFHLYFNKLVLCYLFSASVPRLERALADVEAYWVPSGWTIAALMPFYTSLARLRIAVEKSGTDKRALLRTVEDNRRQLFARSESAPMNFAHLYHLVTAEQQRVLGNTDRALEQFDLAIDAALSSQHIQYLALACELAGGCHLGVQQPDQAADYLRRALRAYEDWGATAKRDHLYGTYDKILPERGEGPVLDLNYKLDLAAFSEASKTVERPASAREMLISLMKLSMENMGADKVVLQIEQHSPAVLVLSCVTGGLAEIWFDATQAASAAGIFIDEALQLVRHSGENIRIDESNMVQRLGIRAGSGAPGRQLPRALLILVIKNKGDVLGYLYLENSVSTHAFTEQLEGMGAVFAAHFGVVLRDMVSRSALRVEQKRFQAVLHAAPDATFLVAEDNTIKFANAQCEALFGRTEKSMLGLQVCELVPLEGRENVDRMLSDVRRKVPSKPLPVQASRSDGAMFSGEVNVGRLSGGEQDWLILTMRDVTDRLQLEAERDRQREELTRLSRIAMIGALSSSVTHEISQPLAAILSNAQAGQLTLDHAQPDLSLLHEILDDIAGDSKRGREVVVNLRKLYSNEQLEFTQLDINELVTMTLQLLQGEMNAHKTRLVLELAADLPEIHGGEVSLQQVLLNLASNALQASAGLGPERQRLTVSTKLADRSIVIAVQDQGTGIEDARSASLFEPFFTTRHGGLGVGLMVCGQIVAQHKGQIWFENNRDVGTTFFVSLPLTQ